MEMIKNELNDIIETIVKKLLLASLFLFLLNYWGVASNIYLYFIIGPCVSIFYIFLYSVKMNFTKDPPEEEKSLVRGWIIGMLYFFYFSVGWYFSSKNIFPFSLLNF